MESRKPPYTRIKPVDILTTLILFAPFLRLFVTFLLFDQAFLVKLLFGAMQCLDGPVSGFWRVNAVITGSIGKILRFPEKMG
ncbi:hypothetical protein [Geoalkalibacter subterraneus]|uniref:hypothetical protein n=1 Tax=Geoalkalibacter subterraneus TaxID=483547 RepID=UPI001392293D|nr:hypothetical protein [Geoalkalibacter subterraneus]